MRLASIMATALTLLLQTAPALAEDDAGTRSIFSSPAGTRGIGLGGAYVAVPGDASIAAWNPGGLGWVSRLEAQASTASYDLDFREDFVSVVLPSWRLGTASLTIRRFGTSGIDERDDRNVVTGEDLESSETEIAVGYGRAVTPSLSLGGAIKLQRQSLAGRSGSGLGADVGLTAYPLLLLGTPPSWSSRLSWGVSLRNVIQPSIRLELEPVADPGTWRTGFAYRTLLGLATLDVERGSGAAPRLHAGAEFTPRPLFAIRGGLSGDALSAGAGFRVGSVAVDYAFENRAYAPVHRIGVSYVFGPTVAERRDASLRAEEEKLQGRLTEAFQRVQLERIQSLLARAQESRSRGAYAEALEALGTIATLDPNQPEAADLEVQILRENAAALEKEGDLAGAAVAYGRILERRPLDPDAKLAQGRCRAESDRRAARSADIRKAFGRAMDHFAADDLIAARQEFATILEESPNDEDARAMLRRTQAALGRRAQNLLRDARRSLAARQVDAAAALVEQARGLDPGADGLATLAASIQRARLAPDAPGVKTGEPARTATKATSSRPPELSDRELRELYKRGLAAMEARRSTDALRYFELVWSASPKYQRVAEYLKREYLLLGLDVYSSGRLDEAVAWWEKALQVDPNDARARGYLTRAQQQLERSREVVGETR